MQIVVRQISGLGNQLFQYAAGRYYADRYAASLRVAVDPAGRAFSYGYPRPFLLSHFSIRSPVAELTREEGLLLASRRRLRLVAAGLRRVRAAQVIEETVPQRHTFQESFAFLPGTRTVYLVGYWQTYKIAEALGDSLQEEFAFREPASGQTADVLRQIENTPHPVSLHIRRGDYTLAVEGNRVLPMDYYARAIQRLREQLPSPRFFIFSDDLAFARTHLSTLTDAVFVAHNQADSAHEDLRLMAACHHHIIANSSFSWWGAWLNPRADKRVIAPKQWMMTPSSYFPELLPPTWELLDVA